MADKKAPEREIAKAVRLVRYPLLRRALAEGRVGKGHGLPDPSKRKLRYPEDDCG